MRTMERECKIELTKGYFAVVDCDDFEPLAQFHWYASVQRRGNVYAERSRLIADGPSAKKSVSMHRVVMKAPVHLWVDHINGDTLDNRKRNLRLCNNSENQANRRSNLNSLSIFKGVSWSKSNKKWQAQMTFRQEKIHLGFFESEVDAAIVYDEAAIRLHGEFAKPNILRRK